MFDQAIGGLELAAGFLGGIFVSAWMSWRGYRESVEEARRLEEVILDARLERDNALDRAQMAEHTLNAILAGELRLPRQEHDARVGWDQNQA